MASRVLSPVGYRQHGQAGGGVVLRPIERERPEVGRGPDEDDEEQQPGFAGSLVGHGGPTQHRRHGAGGAADHDVLRRVRFEEHGIDDRVANEGGKRKPHGQRVHHPMEQREANSANHARDGHRLQRIHLAARQRPATGTRHHGVDFLLDEAVHRGCGACHEGYADGGRKQDSGRHHTGRRQKHADHRTKHDEGNDSGLGQGKVLTQSMRRRLQGDGRCSHDWANPGNCGLRGRTV